MVSLRLVLNALLLATAGLGTHGSILIAVTDSSPVKEREHTSVVTTNLVAKARTDVQIRRIKNLIISGEARDEAAFDKLQALQRKLRGER